MDEPLTLDQWLAAVRAALETDFDLSRDEQRALLNLTRVAAHRSERIAAPLTAFLAGMALAPHDPARRATEIDRLTAALEGTESNGGG